MISISMGLPINPKLACLGCSSGRDSKRTGSSNPKLQFQQQELGGWFERSPHGKRERERQKQQGGGTKSQLRLFPKRGKEKTQIENGVIL
jgi:hypothetical protein